VNVIHVQIRNQERKGGTQGTCRTKYEYKPKVQRKNDIEHAFEENIKVFTYTAGSTKEIR
jgi:hypothetical protein